MNTNKRHSPGAPQSLMFPRCPHLKTSDISLPCHFTNLTKIFWANTVCLAMWCLGKTLGLEQYSWPLVDRGDRLLQHSKFSETVAPAMLRGHAITESEPQSLNLSKLARRAVNFRRSEAEYNPDWRTELVSCWRHSGRYESFYVADIAVGSEEEGLHFVLLPQRATEGL